MSPTLREQCTFNYLQGGKGRICKFLYFSEYYLLEESERKTAIGLQDCRTRRMVLERWENKHEGKRWHGEVNEKDPFGHLSRQALPP